MMDSSGKQPPGNTAGNLRAMNESKFQRIEKIPTKSAINV